MCTVFITQQGSENDNSNAPACSPTRRPPDSLSCFGKSSTAVGLADDPIRAVVARQLASCLERKEDIPPTLKEIVKILCGQPAAQLTVDQVRRKGRLCRPFSLVIPCYFVQIFFSVRALHVYEPRTVAFVQEALLDELPVPWHGLSRDSRGSFLTQYGVTHGCTSQLFHGRLLLFNAHEGTMHSFRTLVARSKLRRSDLRAVPVYGTNIYSLASCSLTHYSKG